MISKHIKIKGIVQGVGFRPFVWRLAKEFDLSGSVQNGSDGVSISIEGERESINAFINKLQSDTPTLAFISSLDVADKAIENIKEFNILPSDPSAEINTRVSPDMTICQDCKNELFDPNNSRYHHPFINCVNCGPRFSIIEKIPYDRINTSMNSFQMCPECEEEYKEPSNRRYHAQPIACPVCGPKIWVCNKLGEKNDSNWEELWREAIVSGKIIAVKGVGGFHLACDAQNVYALKKLRERKSRENKPFALMTDNLEWIKKHCYLNKSEEKLLLSKEAPIVILKIRKLFNGIEYIAPGLDTIGIMVPYTPMHLLMLKPLKDPIVLTSANYSNEPMICENEAALKSLGNLADLFILNNRDIINRCDDSVTLCRGENVTVIRPGRGFSPFNVSIKSDKRVIALGADLKNTFSLLHHNSITVSPYIGDLEHPDTQSVLQKSIERYLKFYEVTPEFVVHDEHPDFYSTSLALDYAKKFDIPNIGVQHHHAHLVAGYVEHGLRGKAIGFAFDGTGFGRDGTIWGGEVFLFDNVDFAREFHFKNISLPGGDLAVKDPARIAISLSEGSSEIDYILNENLDSQYLQKIQLQLKSDINCPTSSSIARVFEALSFLLGLCTKQTYDGEAAMKLEAIADKDEMGTLPFTIENGTIDYLPMFTEVDKLLRNGTKIRTISARFHNMIVDIIFCCIEELSKSQGILPVVFSGGVFQNRLLVERIILNKKRVRNNLYFSSIPNDSGISIGQAAVGAMLSKLK